MSKDTKAIILIIIDQIIFVIWGVVTHDFLGSLWYWIIGALLPIIALFMTSMVANNIKLMEETASPIEKAETPKEEEELPLEVEKEPLKVPEELQNKEVPAESPHEAKNDEKRHIFFSADTLLGKK